MHVMYGPSSKVTADCKGKGGGGEVTGSISNTGGLKMEGYFY